MRGTPGSLNNATDRSDGARPWGRRRAAPARALLVLLALLALPVTALAATPRAAHPAPALISSGSKITLAGGAGNMFGFTVALSADGETALVGSKYANGADGGAWVLSRSGSSWAFGPRLPDGEEAAERCSAGEECGFGRSVAISADGNTAVVGAPQHNGGVGAVLVFTRSGSKWTQQGAALSGSEESGEGFFGRSVALSANGNTLLVGGSADRNHRGAAWVFTRSGATWSQQGGKLTGTGESGAGYFGFTVTLSADGNTALIGAPGDALYHGAVWEFTRSDSSWSVSGSKLTGGAEEQGGGRFGYSVALSADASTALIGARWDDEGAGAAWVLKSSGAGWAQQGPKLIAGEEVGKGEFGYNVALSADGATALVGGPRDETLLGAAWSFQRTGETWTQEDGKLTGVGENGRGWFGASVALSADGRTAMVGGPRDNEKVGAAWSFDANTPPPAPPTVTSVTPSGGGLAGTPVSIRGTGFLPGATVTIGVPASAITYVSETELLATTGTETPGAYEVVVKDGYGTSTSGPLFNYAAPPTVTSVTPSGGGLAGTPVSIRGTGFLPGATVTIGVPASAITYVSETELLATTGTETPGAYEVVVTDAYGTSTSGPLFTYAVPPEEEPEKELPKTLLPLVGSGGVLGSIEVLPTGATGNIVPVSGIVLVQVPGGTLVPLTGLRQVPFGTLVDARHGSVEVTTIGPDGKPQVITFYDGEFILSRGAHGRVVATLAGGGFSKCPTKRERAHRASISSNHTSRSHVVRKLWASGHGSYQTKGSYATGAVLGTVWLTEDRCNGTVIRVITDRVAVVNLVNHKHVIVKAGHSYFAKAP